jgi:hypothetical protein
MLLRVLPMESHRSTHQRARLALAWLGLLALACASKSNLADGGVPPGAGGGAGTVQTGGNRAEGGVPGRGGTVATGGVPGTGGGLADAAVACTDDAGSSLPAIARGCAQDEDCTIAIAARCCGADRAVGVAKAQASAYAPCLALPPGACQGLGCAKFLGYTTDTGATTPAGSAGESLLDVVTVRCSNQACTTDVVAVEDGGRDAPATEAAVDLANQNCGNDPPCGPGQACVLISGGPMPPCAAPSDAGTCAAGQVTTASCYDPSTGTSRQPGCTTAAPTPHCAQLADGCDGTCACVCPAVGGADCSATSGIINCAMP